MLSGRDRKLEEMAVSYEAAKAEGRSIYMDAEDLADLADWYGVHGDFERALDVACHGLNLHPGNTELLVQKAYLLLDFEKLEEAESVADELAGDPASEAQILKATLLLERGEDEEARRMVEEIEDKDDLPNIVEVAYMYIDHGELDDAWEWLERGIGRYDEDESFLAVLADYHYSTQDYEEAMKHYDRLIDSNPYSASYWYGLACCHFELEHYDKAIEACEYARMIDEDATAACIMLGHSYHHLGNKEEALKYYRMAVERKEVAPVFLNIYLATEALQEEKWKEAYEHLYKMEKQGAKVAVVNLYSNMAFCLYRLGREEEALHYCQLSEQEEKDELNACLVVGRIYMEMGKKNEALAMWSRALELVPGADTWNEIGMINLEVGKFSLAKKAFECVKEEDPDFKGINERMAVLYLLMKDRENFMKYNRLCAHPMKADKVDELIAMMENRESDDLSRIVRGVFASFR